MDVSLTRPKQIVNQSQWLSEFSCNISSQFGEDGILEKILEVIAINDQWCVEFGAWDGRYLSNTFNLIENKAYSAVLIEPDVEKFKILTENFIHNDRVHCSSKMVGYNPPHHLDAILSEFPIPKNFDLLSIDIDGNDYYVWEAIQDYQPKVVVIEYNPTIPNHIDFIQSKKPELTQGSSLKALVKLGKKKGYELVAVTTTNGIFVEHQYFPLFNIADNTLEALRDDRKLTTYLFMGFDGTIFLRGNMHMPWHNINLTESRIQQLPRFLRRFPDRYNWLQRWLSSFYFRFRK